MLSLLFIEQIGIYLYFIYLYLHILLLVKVNHGFNDKNDVWHFIVNNNFNHILIYICILLCNI